MNGHGIPNAIIIKIFTSNTLLIRESFLFAVMRFINVLEPSRDPQLYRWYSRHPFILPVQLWAKYGKFIRNEAQ